MDTGNPTHRKPLFACIALGCALVAGTLLLAAGSRQDAGEIVDGYSTLAVMVSFMVAMTLSGLITGQIGLIRGEKPAAISILALVLNGAIFIIILTQIPR